MVRESSQSGLLAYLTHYQLALYPSPTVATHSAVDSGHETLILKTRDHCRVESTSLLSQESLRHRSFLRDLLSWGSIVSRNLSRYIAGVLLSRGSLFRRIFVVRRARLCLTSLSSISTSQESWLGWPGIRLYRACSEQIVLCQLDNSRSLCTNGCDSKSPLHIVRYTHPQSLKYQLKSFIAFYYQSLDSTLSDQVVQADSS